MIIRNLKHFTIISYLLFSSLTLSFSQQNANISGKITDQSGAAVFMANVSVWGRSIGVSTSITGHYNLNIPSQIPLKIIISCIGYLPDTINITANPGQKIELNRSISVYIKDIAEVSVTARPDLAGNLQRIDAQALKSLPNSSGNVESLIKTLAGVSSNNELSSQYSVRGGSYDENLIYVNDIEIYRPQLVRSGQQEGLSFVNSDMIQSIKFSAGGFESSYGDKMASVLDITYKKPVETAGTFSASLLSSTFHLEGTSKNKKFTYLTGIRYKTNKYLLGSLDTKGEYQPNFVDFQSLFTYDITSKLEASFLGYYSSNQYNFIPEDRETKFGTYDRPISVRIFYDGGEYDKFSTGLGAFTLNYKVNSDLSLKLIGSAFRTNENETFDIEGAYWTNEVGDNQTNKDSIPKYNYGTYLNHARNRLIADVYSFSHKGSWLINHNKIKWGITYQKEIIEDRVREWDMIDSAEYSIPYNPQQTALFNSIRSNNSLNSNRFHGFIQDTREFYIGEDILYINAGLRANYWDLNKEMNWSPRASVSYKPANLINYLFYLSSGFYNQPAFYREMRNAQGTLNTQLKSQKSLHYVLGSEHSFVALDRPFKLTTELYYKDLWDLVPYKVENVRMQYQAQNSATGYTTGIDIKLNGEFVKGAESWASISIMRSRENIKGDYYVDNQGELQSIGYYPRPTDQLINFNLFFQDYLPNNPSYKVHLTLAYGSALPVSLPKSERYDKTFRMPSYQRIDIGFSKLLKDETQVLSNPYNPLRYCKSAWIAAEIFNLLDFNNTNSYLWLKTVSDDSGLSGFLAVPNHLTGRRLNVKLILTF